MQTKRRIKYIVKYIGDFDRRIGEFTGCRFYAGLRLDYRLGVWAGAPTSASRAISAVAAEVLVYHCSHAVSPSTTCPKINFT